jgi:leucyl aminopeptidase
MDHMTSDMGGAAAVIATTVLAARLELPVAVTATVPMAENMPSATAYRPGDVLRMYGGKTVEVLNTDAEGRLVLADCLAHAIDQGAERLVDLATLTGAIVTTFGNTYAGLFGSDDEWCAAVEAAGRRAGEAYWRLPLHDEYDELIKSRYADISNAVEARKAGSITAAQFLRRFTGDVPWAHLDIAGTAYENGKPYTPKGGAGFGVRTLVELARANTGAPDLH